MNAPTDMDSASKKPGWMLPSAIAFLVGGVAALVATRTDLATSGSYRLFFGLWRTRHLLLGGGLLGLGLLLLAGRISPKLAQRLLAVALGTGLGAMGLEGIGRAGLVDWQAELRPEQRGELSFEAIKHVDESGVTKQDLAQAWNIPTEEISYRYRTDQRGFRNAEDRERADIYCVGDSFVVAGLIPFEETLPARLEQTLVRPAMGIALSGLSPAQEIEQFRNADLEVAGSLVLHFLFEGNDLQDTAIAKSGTNATPTARTNASFINTVIGLIQEGTQPAADFAALRSGLIEEQRVYFRWGGADAFPHLGELDGILEDLQAFGDELEERGARYVVCLIPSKLRVLGPLCTFDEGALYGKLEEHLSEFPERVAAWGQESGIPVLNLEPELAAAARTGSLPWFEADTHWNARGVEAAVQAIQNSAAVATWSGVQR